MLPEHPMLDSYFSVPGGGTSVRLQENARPTQSRHLRHLIRARPWLLRSARLVSLVGMLVDEEALRMLAQFQAVKVIDLTGTQVSSLDPLAAAPQLEMLCVLDCPQIGEPQLAAFKAARAQTGFGEVRVQQDQAASSEIAAAEERDVLDTMFDVPGNGTSIKLHAGRADQVETPNLALLLARRDWLPGKAAYVSLAGSRIDDETLSHLASFTAVGFIDLSRTAVQTLQPLVSIRSLHDLDVRGCVQLDESEVSAFVSARPDVRLYSGEAVCAG